MIIKYIKRTGAVTMALGLLMIAACNLFLADKDEGEGDSPATPGVQEYFTLTIDGDFCDGYMVYADAYDADDTINPLASVSRRISAVDRTLSFPVDKGLAAKGLTGGEDIVIGMFADEDESGGLSDGDAVDWILASVLSGGDLSVDDSGFEVADALNPSFEVLVINNTGDDFSGKYVTACLYPSFPAGRDFLDYFKDPALDPDDLQSDLIAVNEQLFDSAIKELPLYPPGISGTEWYVPGNYVLCVYVEMDVSVEGENRSDLPSPGDYVYSRSITVDELLQDELVLLEDDDVWSIFRLTVAYPDDPEEDVGGCELEAGIFSSSLTEEQIISVYSQDEDLIVPIAYRGEKYFDPPSSISVEEWYDEEEIIWCEPGYYWLAVGFRRNNTLYYHISPLVLENGINDGTIDLDLDGYDRELLVPDELEELQPDWYGFLDGSLGALTEVEHIIYFPDLPAESGTFTRYYRLHDDPGDKWDSLDEDVFVPVLSGNYIFNEEEAEGTLTITEAAIFAELLLRQDFPEEDLDIPSLADLGISGFGSEDSFMALHTRSEWAGILEVWDFVSSGEEVNEALDYYFTTEEYGIWVDVFGEKVGMVLQGDGSDSFFFCEDRELSKLGYGGTFLYEDFRDPDPDVIP